MNRGEGTLRPWDLPGASPPCKSQNRTGAPKGHERTSPGEGQGLAAAPSWPLIQAVGRTAHCDTTVGSPWEPAAWPRLCSEAGKPATRRQSHTHIPRGGPLRLLVAFHRKIEACHHLCLLAFSWRIREKTRLAQINVENSKRNNDEFYFLGKYRAATSGSRSVRSSK